MQSMTIKTLPNQTIYDIAVAAYGTVSAIELIIDTNPTLANDFSAALAEGLIVDTSQFYFDLPLAVGQAVEIDTDSRLYSQSIVKQIDKPVTTHRIWQDQ